MTEHVFTLSAMRAAIKAVTDGGHSVFSPSGSKMWLGCSGSLIPNLFAPDDSGEDAAYGTVGHMVAELWLKSGQKPRHLLGTKQWVEAGDWGFQIEVDEVMMDHVHRYVSWCKMLPGSHYVETRVDFSRLTPIENQGGTADHCACTYQRMVITDLKMGKGVHVYAKDNSQALLYALGFFYEWDWLYDFQEIEIRIAQPRRENMDTWTVSRKFLLEFAEYVRKRAHAAWVQNAPRTPSADACQWCRVSATCAAYAKTVIDGSGGAFDDIGDTIGAQAMREFRESLMNADEDRDTVDAATLTTEELDKLYAWRGGVERFWKKVALELSKRAAAGAKLKRWKLVEGRTRRAFRSKPEAVKRLVSLGCKLSDVVEEVTVSPAQAEELLRKAGHKTKDLPELMKGLTFKAPGKATLASVKDGRPSLEDVSADAFSDIIEMNEEI